MDLLNWMLFGGGGGFCCTWYVVFGILSPLRCNGLCNPYLLGGTSFNFNSLLFCYLVFRWNWLEGEMGYRWLIFTLLQLELSSLASQSVCTLACWSGPVQRRMDIMRQAGGNPRLGIKGSFLYMNIYLPWWDNTIWSTPDFRLKISTTRTMTTTVNSRSVRMISSVLFIARTWLHHILL